MNEQDPYVCLSLLPGSTAADIKRRYRQLAKRCHPDANHCAGAENTLRELNAAYAFLSDPARKSAYDAAFRASSAVFVSARTPLMPRVYRRRGPSPRRVFGAAVLLLLSLGLVVLFRAENAVPALTRLFSQISSRKPAGPDRPPPSYTFLPSHGAFDDPSGAPPPPAQAGMP